MKAGTRTLGTGIPEEPSRSFAMTLATFATRWNLAAIEAAYQRWQADPNSVDASWQLFFEGFELGASRGAAPTFDAAGQTAIFRLIDAYRDLGRYVAHLDPLSEEVAEVAIGVDEAHDRGLA